MNVVKKGIVNAFKQFQHNKEHYLKKRIFGEELRLCPRCMAEWITIIVTAPFLFAVYLSGVTQSFNFWLVFGISWAFAGVSIVDYLTAQRFHMWDGNNQTRLIAGAFWGLSYTVYLFLLPTHILFNFATLLIIVVFFKYVIISTECRKRGLVTRDVLKKKYNRLIAQAELKRMEILSKFDKTKIRSNKKTIATTSKVSACNFLGCECSGCECGNLGGWLLIATLIILVIFLLLTGITKKSGGCGCCGEEGADEGWCNCDCCNCDDDETKSSTKKGKQDKQTAITPISPFSNGRTTNQMFIDGDIDKWRRHLP